MPDEFDRHRVLCWHGNKLYECEDPEHATPRSFPGRGHAQAETVTYYRGTAEVSTVITDRDSDMYGGVSLTPVECAHRHRDWDAAEECGRRLAVREARRLNKARGIREKKDS